MFCWRNAVEQNFGTLMGDLYVVELVLTNQLSATVLCTAFISVVGFDWLGFTPAFRTRNLASTDAIVVQIGFHDISAAFGQLLVVRIGTHRVSVAFNGNHDLIALEHIEGVVQNGDRIGSQGALVEVKVDAA